MSAAHGHDEPVHGHAEAAPDPVELLAREADERCVARCVGRPVGLALGIVGLGSCLGLLGLGNAAWAAVALVAGLHGLAMVSVARDVLEGRHVEAHAPGSDAH